MQSKTLASFAKIISGHSFRKAITPENRGNAYVFQAKDVIQNEPFTDLTCLVKISYENSQDSSFLRKNDIVVVARGTKFRSTIFLASSSSVIASASIHIIRLTSPLLLPEYVSNYLNSAIGQSALGDKITGNYIGALPVKGLADIQISFPSLDQQQLIVDLHRNVRAQKKLLDHKLNLEQGIINNIFGSLNFIWAHHATLLKMN